MKVYLRLFFICLSAIIFCPSCDKDQFLIGTNSNDIFHVKNGDYLIPVMVRGNTAGKKIILYIQGGPGYNTLDYAKIDYPGFKESLEREYAVAYYDQRGTGNLQGNFDQGESVIATWVDDLHHVAEFVAKAYDAEIIMLGHSFGGALMYRYMIAKGRAGIPVKYISTDSPVTTDADEDKLRWKFRREFLYNTANLEISINRNKEKWLDVQQWLNVTPELIKLEGENPYRLLNQWNRYVEELVNVNTPGKSVKVRDYMNVFFRSSYNALPAFLNNRYNDEMITRILNEEEVYVLMDKLPQIDHQSILMLTGRYDDICPPEELNYIFQQIGSPLKKMAIVENSGHEPFTNQPAAFFQEIKLFIQQ